jgi:hypothetical protein
MENNTQRRIHKYFFLIVFVSYFSAKFHLRECGNQQYTKRGRKKNHRGKVKEVERLQYSRIENICSVRQQPFEICRVRHKLIEIEE